MKQKWFRKALEMRGETIEDFWFLCLFGELCELVWRIWK